MPDSGNSMCKGSVEEKCMAHLRTWGRLQKMAAEKQAREGARASGNHRPLEAQPGVKGSLCQP